MSSLAQVRIHPSQFPDNVRRDLLQSLRDRRINHKFHYDSLKQTRKWLALHAAYSPSRTDSDCAAIYDRSFASAASNLRNRFVHVIGLGCGGGQKDTRLVKMLRDAGKEAVYTPSDVSVSMVLVARQAALGIIRDDHCFPLVCDLASTQDLAETLETADSSQLANFDASHITHHDPRVITCFGMLPNFEPDVLLGQLASLTGVNDQLLFSANLAPGPNYRAGVQHVLPQYDNPLTRDWLMTFLRDLGVEDDDGEMQFSVESVPGHHELLRIAAHFHFQRARRIEVDSEQFDFDPGEALRLFFSCRYTPEVVRALLARRGLEVRDEWIAGSGEEGVFMVGRH